MKLVIGWAVFAVGVAMMVYSVAAANLIPAVIALLLIVISAAMIGSSDGD